MAALSKRLQAIADFVPDGCRPADVGCDHAYLPIYLVQTGKVREALAADVREGPLERAKENIEAAGLSACIGTRLSDGLKEIGSCEADVLVIAGMGGMLTLRILQEGDLSSFDAFVLAPQSDLPQVRRTLMRMGLRITKETLVHEDGNDYPVLYAEHGEDTDDDPVRLRYGKALLPEAYPALLSLLEREHASYQAAMKRIAENAGDHEAAIKRRDELREEIRLNEEARRRIRREQTWSDSTGLQ